MIYIYKRKYKELVSKKHTQTTILKLFVEEECSYRWELCRLESIVMLTILQKYIVKLYNRYILHP